jgi:hypothetical protein
MRAVGGGEKPGGPCPGTGDLEVSQFIILGCPSCFLSINIASTVNLERYITSIAVCLGEVAVFEGCSGLLSGSFVVLASAG